MPKRLRHIGGLRTLNTYQSTPAASVGTWANAQANSQTNHAIRANASSFRFLFMNGAVNYATLSDTDGTDLGLKIGYKKNAGSWASLDAGATWVIPRGRIALSSLVALSVSAGNTLNLSLWAEARTASKLLPVNRFQVASWGEALEFGATLTPKLAGEAISVAIPAPPEVKRGISPGSIVGLTTKKALGFLGHSLVQGDAATAMYGWAPQAADILGRGAFVQAVGGSSPSFNTSTDFGPLRMADVVVVMWAINMTNSFAMNASWNALPVNDFIVGNAGQGVNAARDTIRTMVRRLKGQGLKVILCTEGFAGAPVESAYARRVETRNAWNTYLRTEATGYLEANGFVDTALALETSANSHSPKAGITEELHWNDAGHTAVGQAVADALSTTYAALLTDDDPNYVEVAREDWWRAATSANTTVQNGWRSRQGKTYEDGLGHLATTGETFWEYHTLQNTTITSGMLRGWFSLNASMIGANTFAIGGALVDGNNPALGGGNSANGYSLVIKRSSAAIFRNNVQVVTGNHSTAFSATSDTCQWELQRVVSGGTSNLVARVYRNGSLVTTLTVADSTYVGALNPAIVQRGDDTGGTMPSGTPISEGIVIMAYNPVVVGSVTPTVAALLIVPGATLPVAATVIDDASAVVGGYEVTTSVSQAGVTIGSSAFTTAEGVATFTDASGLYVASSVAIGTTFNITFTAGGITGTLPVTVVDNLSSGGGSGDGDSMFTVTSASVAPQALIKTAFVKIGSAGEKISAQFQGGRALIKYVAAGAIAPTVDGNGTIYQDGTTLERNLVGVDCYAAGADGPMIAQVTK